MHGYRISQTNVERYHRRTVYTAQCALTTRQAFGLVMHNTYTRNIRRRPKNGPAYIVLCRFKGRTSDAGHSEVPIESGDQGGGGGGGAEPTDVAVVGSSRCLGVRTGVIVTRLAAGQSSSVHRACSGPALFVITVTDLPQASRQMSGVPGFTSPDTGRIYSYTDTV